MSYKIGDTVYSHLSNVNGYVVDIRKSYNTNTGNKKNNYKQIYFIYIKNKIPRYFGEFYTIDLATHRTVLIEKNITYPRAPVRSFTGWAYR